MLRNYILVAIRNLLKNKSASLINILGLTIGLCSCLLIGIYIKNELSYDRFEKNGDRIFRVIMEYSFDGSTASKKGNFTSMKVAPTLKKKFPEVENAVGMIQYPNLSSGCKSGEEPASGVRYYCSCIVDRESYID
jgi:putative ABC transport system permease protein